MANGLAAATSPYLLQHKDNPVDWREWSPETLARAQQLDRPILLSIGYAACHWCHVMAHESFENAAIAEAMNRDFVCIKVDREERPDIDAIYQQALAFLGQQGGWPLTMLLTPDGQPFWGGTYFPPEPRYGRPGFPQVLARIAELWRDDRSQVTRNRDSLTQALAGMSEAQAGGVPETESVLEAAAAIGEEIDTIHGGIGTAPKFPQAPAMRLLWQAARMAGNAIVEDRVLHTLRRICQGGIYDHLGGGFARYAVDAFWLVPHFEKMLYDNAQLLELLAMAHGRTGEALFARRIDETISWLEREMLTPAGLASALDADSEGEEGRFYVWTAKEIDELLGADAAFLKHAYGVTSRGNWEGKCILNRLHEQGLPPTADEQRLSALRARLLQRRDKRIRPGRDDKVLADWNGLAVHGIAIAGSWLDRPRWIDLAQDVFDRVVATHADGPRLAHSHRDGRSQPIAFLDDYAQMMRAALTLHEVTGQQRYLDHAQAWRQQAKDDLGDGEGGYFLHGPGTEELILRGRNAHDGPTPSANGTMALALERQGRITGDLSATEDARHVVERFAGDAARNPFAHATLLTAGLLLERPTQLVVLGADGTDVAAFREVVRATGRGDILVLVVEGSGDLPPGHPAAGKTRQGGRTTAYLCIGPTCLAPVTSAAALEALLRDHDAPSG